MHLVTTLQRYAPPLVLALVTAGLWLGGDVLLALVFTVITALLAWWVSPFYGRRGPGHDRVAADPGAYPVVIYWRPGCVFCTRLRGALGRRRRKATWVNIWSDPGAAAYVRSVNDGNETVPTVVLDGTAYTNPDPERVKEALPA